ncbi:hypothetical protein AKO1_011467 [Acrasis kona]|uniref:Uncharacterized protein n=1 Tax=Acrasis kona TaxID=1008807 RepID=A0AAW2Z3P9_9EUKA
MFVHGMIGMWSLSNLNFSKSGGGQQQNVIDSPTLFKHIQISNGKKEFTYDVNCDLKLSELILHPHLAREYRST